MSGLCAGENALRFRAGLPGESRALRTRGRITSRAESLSSEHGGAAEELEPHADGVYYHAHQDSRPAADVVARGLAGIVAVAGLDDGGSRATTWASPSLPTLIASSTRPAKMAAALTTSPAFARLRPNLRCSGAGPESCPNHVQLSSVMPRRLVRSFGLSRPFSKVHRLSPPSPPSTLASPLSSFICTTWSVLRYCMTCQNEESLP
jgi:hypothetical protein